MVLAADVVYVGTGECALSHALLALRRRLPVRQREGSISFLFFFQILSKSDYVAKRLA